VLKLKKGHEISLKLLIYGECRGRTKIVENKSCKREAALGFGHQNNVNIKTQF
jgi:hypothetical protein